MPIRNIHNISGEVIVLPDFRGKEVALDETFDGLSFGESVLKDSASLAVAFLEGKLSLSDGAAVYLGQKALDCIKGYDTQVTSDGKRILTSSDRPKDTYRCFSGRGDDVATGKIGLGSDLIFETAPGTTQSVDVRFVTNVFVKDGNVLFQAAELGTFLDVDVYCPAGIPFPHPTKQGTLDLVNGSFVPNGSGTGEYMVSPTETKLFRFLNHFHILGPQGIADINSPEPFQLFAPYFLRFTLSVPPTAVGPCKACVTVGMYRSRTL